MLNSIPFPAPPGYRWIIVHEFYDWQTQKTIRALDFGKQVFRILVRCGHPN
jgi:hypothetical protein